MSLMTEEAAKSKGCPFAMRVCAVYDCMAWQPEIKTEVYERHFTTDTPPDGDGWDDGVCVFEHYSGWYGSMTVSKQRFTRHLPTGRGCCTAIKSEPVQ